MLVFAKGLTGSRYILLKPSVGLLTLEENKDTCTALHWARLVHIGQKAGMEWPPVTLLRRPSEIPGFVAFFGWRDLMWMESSNHQAVGAHGGAEEANGGETGAIPVYPPQFLGGIPRLWRTHLQLVAS